MLSECANNIGSDFSGFLKRFAIWKILILFATILPGTLSSYSQSYSYELEQIPLENELYGISGTCILQDGEGFIWFTSQNGLFRSNGLEYVQYHMYPNNSDGKTLSAEKIQCLLSDENGILWIGGTNLVRFDSRTEEFKEIRDSYLNDLYSWAYIDCMADDRKGNLWIGNSFRLVKFNKESETFTRFPFLPPEKIDHLMFDRKGLLWIVCGNNDLATFDVETGHFEEIPNAPCTIKTLFEDSKGRIWVATYCGIYLFDRKEKTFTRYFFEPDDPNRLENQMVRAILEDQFSNLWVRTFDGVYMFDEKLELKYQWKQALEYKHSALHYTISTALFEDDQGNIWFFTENEINRIIHKYRNFQVYDPVPEAQSYVDQVFEGRDKHLWFRLNYSLCKLDRNSGSFERYMFHREDSMLMDTIGLAYELCLDNNHNFWMADFYKGLFKLVPRGDRVLHPVPVYEIPDSLPHETYITYPFVDSRERIWFILNHKEMCFFDQEKNRIFRLCDNPESNTRLPESAQVICEYDSNTILVGGWTGIYKIMLPLKDAGEGAAMPADIIEIRMKEENIPINLVSEIIVSKKNKPGTIWANSERGILKLSEEEIGPYQEAVYKGRIFTTRDGLISNTAANFLEDDLGNIWIGSRNGLSKLDPLTENISNYNHRNGLPSNRILGNLNSSEGELFFGTDNGFVSFLPDSFHYNSYIPPIVLTDFSINNQSVNPGEKSLLKKLITYSDSIKLSHDQNNISFAFASLNYIESSRNEYKYMLEGLHDEWVFAGHRNRAEFTNLRPGEYIFRVLGSNNEGVWNEEGARLHIRILAPPWRTWWAYVIYAFLLLLLIRWYRNYILGRTKLEAALEVEKIEKEKVLELDQMRSQFIANVSHEFRTPLTLLVNPLEDSLRNKSEEPGLSRKVQRIMLGNARRLQRLINQLLDISKLESGEIKLHLIIASLSDFVRALAGSFLSLAESRNIRFEIKIDIEEEYSCFDQDKMEKIISNLLSNAFKFCSDGGVISMGLEYGPAAKDVKEGFALLTVADTGKGIEKEQLDKIFDRFYQVSESDTREVEGSGIGLALTKELVELMHGEIQVESMPGKGSIFKVSFPVARECFNQQELKLMGSERHQTLDRTSRGYELSDISDYSDEKEALEEEEGSDKNIEKEVILVVEDNPELRSYICDKFREQYQLIEAGNGKEGMGKAIEHIPNLVITDLMMPHMGGVEMCRELKEHPATNHIPLIMLTAKADKRSRLEGLEAAADDYVSKPFDSEILVARARNLIIQRKELRKHFEKEMILSGNEYRTPNPKFRMLKDIIRTIEEHMGNPDFHLDSMTAHLNLSRSGIYRKVFAVTGSTPHELVRLMRMKRAASLLRDGEQNVNQVMYDVGMRNQSHFAKSFRRYYGINPGKYRNDNFKDIATETKS